eukprot:TRINITY_DN5200_c0_g1_i2.p1 TRINITY_DN5200_c0_g1~~TRINITY_DN5200_c0_g1_i2.p1  ORF type:complete len:531 (-),score=104.09 TRINITY_DN5200_c0_g1_i2:108-1700(-)
MDMHQVQYPYPYPCQAQRPMLSQQAQLSQPMSNGAGALGMQPMLASQALPASHPVGELPSSLQQGFVQQEAYPAHINQPEAATGPAPEAAPLEVEQEVITLRVPEGALPGSKLQYKAPDGQELRLTVPEGVPPGSVMTLTQDPDTKQWKCMADPADAEPEPPAAYAPKVSGPPAVTQHFAQQQIAQPQIHQQIVQPHLSQGPVVNQVLPHVMPHPMPVNLSYVPPPAVGPTSMSMAPGQVDPARFNPPRQDPGLYSQPLLSQRPSQLPAAFEQRPSYTPPPANVMEQRPSYVPMPQVLPAHPVMHGMTGPMPAIDPNALAATGKVIVGQTPSYVPPPVALPQQQHSYVPPVAMGMQSGPAHAFDLQAPIATVMPADKGPSIHTLPPSAPTGPCGPIAQPHPAACNLHMAAPMAPVSHGMPCGFNAMTSPAALPQVGIGFPQLAPPMGHPSMSMGPMIGVPGHPQLGSGFMPHQPPMGSTGMPSMPGMPGMMLHPTGGPGPEAAAPGMMSMPPMGLQPLGNPGMQMQPGQF